MLEERGKEGKAGGKRGVGWGWGGQCARGVSSRQLKKGRVDGKLISRTKLQARVYDILPPTTAIVDYAVGLEKLSANEQFFWWGSNGSQFVTNSSNKSDVSLQTTLLTQVQFKPYLPGVYESHVYVGAWAPSCFHSLISTQTPNTGLRHSSFNHCRI